MKLDLCGRGPRGASSSCTSIVRTGLFLGCALVVLAPLAVRAQNTINTIVGGGNPVPGNAPLAASLGGPGAVVEDASGNIYVSGLDGEYVFKVSAQNVITVLAGTGYFGFGPSGTSAPATSVPVTFPAGLALDSTASNLFIAAAFSQHVFEVNLATGTLSNFAGSASSTNPPGGGFGGDGGPATQALLNAPEGVAVFGSTVYIADTGNNRIRMVNASGTISTFAGTGTACAAPPACGDGGPASSATLNSPSGIAVDSAGDLFIADAGDNEIREVSAATGTISTVAGNGIACSGGGCGDGGLATAANLNAPNAVYADALDNLYIADEGDEKIRFVNSDSQGISTVAGDGTFAFSGDGGPATAASLDDPTGVYLDSFGDILISERGSSRIREVGFDSEIINTIIGGGTGGDGGPPLSSVFGGARDVAVDAAGDLYVIDGPRVREVPAGTQTISTVAGNGTEGFSGDGGAATMAVLNVPFGVAVDRTNGNIFIADNGNNDIRTVQNGVISTYAGTGTCPSPTSPCGDGEPASAAAFNHPQSVILDPSGNVLIADVADNRIRKVDNLTQLVSTVAGTGNTCPVSTSPCGDGGPATAANLTTPSGIAVDSSGNIFIADSGDNRIRRVDATTQVITTVAFNGQATFSGDGGPATLASMAGPGKIALDPLGNLFISGSESQYVPVADHVVRRLDAATQTVATVAGNAAQPQAFGFGGDGGPATAATLVPAGITVNSTGGLYIADNNRVRFVQLSPTAALAPANLDFGNQSVGVASSPQAVTLTNTGSDDLLISSIADANGFSQTNNCPIAPKPLAPSQSCTINVTFTGTGTGAANDTLIITDNAAGSPQRIPLTAVAQAPFSLTSNCTSLSVVPGQTAIYTVDLAPAKGFTQSVTLSCTGAPALATCTVSPSKVTLDGSTTVQAKVTATTTPATSGFLQSPFGRSNGNRLAGLIGLAGMAGLAALVVLPGKRRVRQARRLWGLVFCLCMLSTMTTMSSCGGGGAGADPPGTAAGTYPLAVTATFQSSTGATFTEKVSFNLVVQ